MTISHRPDISTLMAFSAGTLDEPYAVVVATHLAMSPESRKLVHQIEEIGGALLSEEPEAEMAPDSLDRLLGRLDDAAPEPIRVHRKDPKVPAPLAPYLPDGLDAAPWKMKAPGVWTCDLPTEQQDGGRLMMLRVRGGLKVPEHGHGGQELTLILQGAYSDRFGRFGVGDVADHDQDVEHQPIAEPGEDCICLVAVDAKLNFRSRLMRLIQPLTGI